MSSWYYAHDGKQNGPVPISELQRLAANGDFDPQKDLVWQDGLPDWKPATAVPELSSLLTGSRPASSMAPVESTTSTPSPYQSPTAQSPAPVPAPPTTVGAPESGLAVAALICGIVSVLTCCIWFLAIPLSIAAIVTGHMASSRISRDPARYAGKGYAKVGLILGYLALVLTAIVTAISMYLVTLSPSNLEQIDWLPPEAKEKLREMHQEVERQQNLQENP